jgi:hypothetical protein
MPCANCLHRHDVDVYLGSVVFDGGCLACDCAEYAELSPDERAEYRAEANGGRL